MPLGSSGIFHAAALIFFSYLGFEEIVKLSEETKNPERNIPLGLVLAVSTSIVLYVLVAFSAVSILDGEIEPILGSFCRSSFSLSWSERLCCSICDSSLATANTVLLMLLAASRIAYGMANSSSIPEVLGKVHSKTRTPWVAILFIAILSTGFILLANIGYLAGVTNFTVFFTFIVINAAVIMLRSKKADLQRPFRVPIAIGRFPVLPTLGIILNIFMLTQLSFQVLTAGLLLTLSGILAHFLYEKVVIHRVG